MVREQYGIRHWHNGAELRGLGQIGPALEVYSLSGPVFGVWFVADGFGGFRPVQFYGVVETSEVGDDIERYANAQGPGIVARHNARTQSS